MWNRTSFIVALLISVLLHALILLVVKGEGDRVAPPDSPSDPIEITLVRPAHPDRTSAPEIVEPSTPDSERSTGAPERSTPLIEPPEPDTSPPAPEQLASDERRLRESILTTVTEQQYVTALDAYRAPTCNPVERASVVRVCAPLEVPQKQDATQMFSGLFSDSLGPSRRFKRDMDTVDRLLEQASRLQALDPSDPHQSALVAEQRQHIREDILRIDRKYQEVNLLRLIPMGARAIKGLREALRSGQTQTGSDCS